MQEYTPSYLCIYLDIIFRSTPIQFFSQNWWLIHRIQHSEQSLWCLQKLGETSSEIYLIATSSVLTPRFECLAQNVSQESIPISDHKNILLTEIN